MSKWIVELTCPKLLRKSEDGIIWFWKTKPNSDYDLEIKWNLDTLVYSLKKASVLDAIRSIGLVRKASEAEHFFMNSRYSQKGKITKIIISSRHTGKVLIELSWIGE